MTDAHAEPAYERFRAGIAAALASVPVPLAIGPDALRDDGALWLPDRDALVRALRTGAAARANVVLVAGDAGVLETLEREHGVIAYTLPPWAARPQAAAAVADIGAVASPEHAPSRALVDLVRSLPFRTAVEPDPDAAASFSLLVDIAEPWGEGELLPAGIATASAAGVPALVRARGDLAGFGGALALPSRAEICAVARALLADLEPARAAVAAAYEAALSPEALARALARIVTEPPGGDAAARAAEWRAPHEPFRRPASVPAPGPVPPPVEQQRAELGRAVPRTPHPYRILHIGSYVAGETDVVRRMVRSLQALGHEVLTVNPRHYGPPFGYHDVISGVKPIELPVEMLEPLIERFEPRIVLFNAGGFHPSRAAAESLRARGILLLHCVLSDPDAQETTLAYLDRFDAVATNAARSVQAYRQAGARFVRHMPFAVDREMIVLPVEERADLRADVICMGHGRPERIEPMRALGERFAVRVYGKNWHVRSQTVRGADLLSALRSAKVHVNFPRTWAGFTNVKVGVFESMSQGGVVCTEIFDEMGALFAYEREIVGYSSAGSLVHAVGYLLDHPEELEEIRRRGFARLLADHLYEHRWQQLFDDLETEGLLRWQPAERRRRFVVLGYYGMRNGGDDLILRTIDRELRARFPDCRVQVIGFNKTRLLLEEGFEAVEMLDIFEAEDMIRGADAFIFGGGGLVHDYTFVRSGGIPDLVDNAGAGLAGLGKFLLLARAHEVPVVWLAIGAGPVGSPDAKRLVRFLAGDAAITARDDDSVAVLGESGVEATLVADPTYLIPRPEDAQVKEATAALGLEPGGYVFVALRRWRGAPEGFETRIAAALDRVVERTGLRVALVPLQRGSGQSDDGRIHADVLEAMARPDAAVLVPTETALGSILGVLAGARAGLAMRLHGSILANAFGVPTVALAYDPKVTGHHRSLGTPDRVFDLAASAQELADALEGLAAAPEAAAAVFAETVAAARERARIPFDRIVELVRERVPPDDQPESFPRRHSPRDVTIDRLQRQVDYQRVRAGTAASETVRTRKELRALQRRYVRYDRIRRNPIVRLAARARRLVRGKRR